MRHLRSKIFFVLITFGLLLNSCKRENLCDCFKGTGPQTEEMRSVGPFDKVNITEKIDVHLIQGSEYSIKIVAGKHLVKLIRTEVKDGTLYISDHNKCDFTRSYKNTIAVYVTMPSLLYVRNDGVGDCYMDNTFTCDTLRYYMSNSGNLHLDVNAYSVYGGMHGNGDVYMKGIVHNNSVWAGGQGYYHGYETDAVNVILTLNTSGSMEVLASEYLKIDMAKRSTGNIYYKGYPPNIEKHTFYGTGKLIEEN